MFGIVFDLDYRAAQTLHPKGSRQAYRDIELAIRPFGFERMQQSFFLSRTNDLSILLRALNALRALPWFAVVVSDIRAFRLENDSDMTTFMKEPAP